MSRSARRQGRRSLPPGWWRGAPHTVRGVLRAQYFADREDGIGAWSLAEFVTAMKFGVRADGAHLYPTFPYTSHQRMRVEDIIDLKSFLDTLPPVAGVAPAHELPFPFNIRRGLGMWKLLYVDGQTLTSEPGKDAAFNRGAYLVNGPGHCVECHTPRNLIGGVDAGRWMAGGPAPEGKGKVPNITQHQDAIGWWTADDIVFMFTDGITPIFEDVGGAMEAVQRNLARLEVSDLEAIAHFPQSVPRIAPDKKRGSNINIHLPFRLIAPG